MAYQSDESGDDEIYVRPFPDVDARRWRISTEGGHQPLWAIDGSELFYLSSAGGMMAVQIQTKPDFQASAPRELFSAERYRGMKSAFSTRPRIHHAYDVSPDGRFLMIKALDTAEVGAGNDVVLVQNWFEELKRLVPAD